MNPLTLKQTIKRKSYSGISDMEYLAESIDKESLHQVVDQFLDFTEKCVEEGWFDNYQKDSFIKLQLTILGLLTNLGHEDMIWSYHVDTQERDKCWRVQIFVSAVFTGLCSPLRECPLCNNYAIYLGGDHILPKIGVFNGELVITLVADKKPEYCQ